jgi:hypothetical protein
MNTHANVTFDNPSDNIDSLPTDQLMPTHDEIQLVDTLFQKQHTFVQRILLHTQDVLLIGFLFIIFSLPQVDIILRRFIPSTESPYILLFVKALLFMFVYFILKNLYLVRKK